MKFVERILLALVGLLVITFITIIFVVPESLGNILDNLAGVNIVLRLVVVLVLDVLILAFVYLRLRPSPRSIEGLVVKAPGAIADISIDSARARILSAVQRVPNVISVDAKLEAVRGKASIEMDVTVRDSDVNIPRKQQEINTALKEVINKQLGLSMLGNPRVHIHLQDEKVTPLKPKVESKPKEDATILLPDRPQKPESTPIVSPATPVDASPKDATIPSKESGKTEEDQWLQEFLVENGDNDSKSEKKSDLDDTVKP